LGIAVPTFFRKMSRYQDRRHAGRVLASALSQYAGRADVQVLALRGRVPLAYEVATRLADFSQTTDEQVRERLEAARREQAEREYTSAGGALMTGGCNGHLT
jgi:predicted phosphoribosyltransferase